MRIKKNTLLEVLDEMLEEMSTTMGMSGGEGPPRTPHAFTGGGKANKSLSILRKYLTDTKRTFNHTKKS
mgnify:CR=1 FL=1